MVSKDKNFIFANFSIVVSSFEVFNNDQKLLIVGFVLSLSGDYLLREKSYWVSLANFQLNRIWIFVGHMIG